MAFMTNDKNINHSLWITFVGYIPLLLILPGLLTKHYRSYSWLCFLMLAYFISYVVQVYSPTRDLHDSFGLAATVVVFISAMFASRWLQRLQVAAR
jgi:uncharacterized membrane protein